MQPFNYVYIICHQRYTVVRLIDLNVLFLLSNNGNHSRVHFIKYNSKACKF
jgi:hypothetical protein